MRRLLLASILLCSWSGTAYADSTSAKERRELRKIVQKYADCVVKGHHLQAKAVLISNSDNSDILSHHSSVVDDSCMDPGVTVTFPSDFYRYSLAEALVRTDFLSSGPSSFRDRLPLAHLIEPNQAELDKKLAATKSASKKKKIKEDFDKDILRVAYSRYGECVARVDPEGSRLWILTPPDGAEEASRIKVIMPAFSQCLDPGSTIRFGREQLRGAVALNYYRLAYATPQPAVGTVH